MGILASANSGPAAYTTNEVSGHLPADSVCIFIEKCTYDVQYTYLELPHQAIALLLCYICICRPAALKVQV